MLRAGSDHLGMKLGLCGVFWMLGQLNVVMVCWIGHIGLYVVEPRKVRLPVDRNASWKKRQQKSAGACTLIFM